MNILKDSGNYEISPVNNNKQHPSSSTMKNYNHKALVNRPSKQPKKKVLSRKNSPQTSFVRKTEKYYALFDYEGYGENELKLRKRDEVEILNNNEVVRTNWWEGRIGDRRGLFPKMYVTRWNNRSSSSNHRRLIPKKIYLNEIDWNETIGQGGFAKVYKGMWRNKEVAVKEFKDAPTELNVDNEARLFWLLRHPNVISLIGVCLKPPNYVLVMDYAKGGPLSEVLSNNLLSPKIIVDWSIQIAKGMKYLHNDAPKMIIHRDLKSTNILIYEPIENGNLENKTLKITDFGLARQATQTTLLTNAAGTYKWMAPEVITEHKASKPSDVWSFGVVLWELLTSQVPFKNFNQYQIVVGVGRNCLRLYIPNSCPEHFKQLLQGCWQKDPETRPTFENILYKLNEIQNSSFIHEEQLFRLLQRRWINEIEVEMESRHSESSQNAEELFNPSHLENIIEGLKQHYAEFKKREMELFEKEIYYTIKQMNTSRIRNKRGIFSKFSWKKRQLKDISSPTGFRHKLHTVVVETNIDPNNLSPGISNKLNLTLHRFRLETDNNEENSSSHSHDNEISEPKISIKNALREIFNMAVTITLGRNEFVGITKCNRISILPPNSRETQSPVIEPSDNHSISIETSQPTENETSNSPGEKLVYKTFRSLPSASKPFQADIVQTPTKSKVFITGNNPIVEVDYNIFNTRSTRTSIYSSLSNVTSNYNTLSSSNYNCDKYGSFTSIKNTQTTRLSIAQSGCDNRKSWQYLIGTNRVKTLKNKFNNPTTQC